MAANERLLTQPIDRTPYAGCAWVAVIVIGCFLIGASFLWHASGNFKRGGGFHFNLTAPSGSSSNLIDQVKQAAGQSASTAVQNQVDSAKQQAADALKAEADKQIKQS